MLAPPGRGLLHTFTTIGPDGRTEVRTGAHNLSVRTGGGWRGCACPRFVGSPSDRLRNVVGYRPALTMSIWVLLLQSATVPR